MNIKALIISTNSHKDKMYDCEISIPALKIHVEDKVANELSELMPKSNYTNIIFMVNGNPIEVAIYQKEKNVFYANAKQIADMDLTKMPILKENTLIKKYTEKTNVGSKEKTSHVSKEKANIVNKEKTNPTSKKRVKSF